MPIALVPLPENLDAPIAAVTLATWFGTGLVEPLRAGLAVATVALLVLLPLRRDRAVLAVLSLMVTSAGALAAEAWGSASGVVDDRRIVVDEVAGFVAALVVVGARDARMIAATAIAFLALDRLKPWPFDRIEAVPGGFGVMLDDLVLGIAIGIVAVLTRRIADRLRANDPPTGPSTKRRQ